MPGEVPLLRRRVIVEGLVQGVGFRWFVRERARRSGLSGWVRNLSDGRVELFVSGPQTAVLQLTKDLAVGPKGAQVQAVRELGDEPNEKLPFPFVIHR